MAESTDAWPVGLRFKPTEEELVSHHLTKKLGGGRETICVIPELHIYDWEPPGLFTRYNELSSIPSDGSECFFFCPRGRKRKTQCGFWKETSRRRDIRAPDTGKPIGIKRILVYYEGQQSKGHKTDVAMHEYHLNSNASDGEILDPVLDFSSFASPNSAPLTWLQEQTASVLYRIINWKSKKAKSASTSVDLSGPSNLNDSQSEETQEISVQASPGTVEFLYSNKMSNFNLQDQNVLIPNQHPQTSKEQRLSHDDHRHVDEPSDGHCNLPYSPSDCINLTDLFNFHGSTEKDDKLE